MNTRSLACLVAFTAIGAAACVVDVPLLTPAATGALDGSTPTLGADGAITPPDSSLPQPQPDGASPNDATIPSGASLCFQGDGAFFQAPSAALACVNVNCVLRYDLLGNPREKVLDVPDLKSVLAVTDSEIVWVQGPSGVGSGVGHSVRVTPLNGTGSSSLLFSATEGSVFESMTANDRVAQGDLSALYLGYTEGAGISLAKTQAVRIDLAGGGTNANDVAFLFGPEGGGIQTARSVAYAAGVQASGSYVYVWNGQQIFSMDQSRAFSAQLLVDTMGAESIQTVAPANESVYFSTRSFSPDERELAPSMALKASDQNGALRTLLPMAARGAGNGYHAHTIAWRPGANTVLYNDGFSVSELSPTGSLLQTLYAPGAFEQGFGRTLGVANGPSGFAYVGSLCNNDADDPHYALQAISLSAPNPLIGASPVATGSLVPQLPGVSMLSLRNNMSAFQLVNRR